MTDIPVVVSDEDDGVALDDKARVWVGRAGTDEVDGVAFARFKAAVLAGVAAGLNVDQVNALIDTAFGNYLVRSDDIVNNAIQSRHIGAGQVMQSDLADNAVDDRILQSAILTNVQNQVQVFIQEISALGEGVYRNLGSARGTPNAIVLASPEAHKLTTYGQLMASFRTASAVTGAATLQIDGLPVKSLLQQNGDALVAGLIGAGDIVLAVHDEVTDSFHCMGVFPVGDRGGSETGATIRAKLGIDGIASYNDVSIEPQGIAGDQLPGTIYLHVGRRQTSRTLSRLQFTIAGQTIHDDSSPSIRASGDVIPIQVDESERRKIAGNITSSDDRKQVDITFTFSDGSSEILHDYLLVNTAARGIGLPEFSPHGTLTGVTTSYKAVLASGFAAADVVGVQVCIPGGFVAFVSCLYADIPNSDSGNFLQVAVGAGQVHLQTPRSGGGLNAKGSVANTRQIVRAFKMGSLG